MARHLAPLVVASMLAVGASATWAPPLSAQVIRGTVRESASRGPVAGAIVSVFRAESVTAARGPAAAPVSETLTDIAGRYAIVTGGAGNYVVVVKRIGALPFTSEPVVIATGTTLELDAILAPIGYTLPEVAVSAATPCRARGRDASRIAQLWEEARAALTATALSREEGRVVSTVTRYRRMLSPDSLAVLGESEAVDRSRSARPFLAIDPDSLDAGGYARRGADGMIEYFAPDEMILRSHAFLRSHCFSLARDASDAAVGLAFEPLRERRTSDISGVLWLDPVTYELQRLQFRFVRAPLPVNDARIGGEVRFERLPSGAWFIAQWYLRVPHVEERLVLSPLAGGVRPAPTLVAFAETGGWAMPDVRRVTGGRGRLAGRVLDSAGVAPLRGALVSALGTGLSARTSADGSFELDSLPVGRHTLLVEAPGYDRLGMTAAQSVVDIEAGGRHVTLIRALTTREVLHRWCGSGRVEPGVAIRLTLPDLLVPDSVPTHSVRVSWDERRRPARGVRGTVRHVVERALDPANGVTICGVTPGSEVQVEERAHDGRLIRRSVHVAPWSNWRVFELPRIRWSTPP